MQIPYLYFLVSPTAMFLKLMFVLVSLLQLSTLLTAVAWWQCGIQSVPWPSAALMTWVSLMPCRCPIDSINSLDQFHLPHKATYKNIKTSPTMAPLFFTSPDIFLILKFLHRKEPSQSHEHACISKFDKTIYVVLWVLKQNFPKFLS